MQDLGTLGGTYGHPDWINDAGEWASRISQEMKKVTHSFGVIER
jgi:hypothetical protein